MRYAPLGTGAVVLQQSAAGKNKADGRAWNRSIDVFNGKQKCGDCKSRISDADNAEHTCTALSRSKTDAHKKFRHSEMFCLWERSTVFEFFEKKW